MDQKGPIIENVEKSTNDYIAQNRFKFFALLVLMVAISVAFVLYTHANAGYVAIFFLIACLFIYSYVQSKIEHKFVQQFGASIGFDYAPTGDMSSVDGKLFKTGHGQKIYDVLSSVRNERDSRVYSFQFTIGYGKGSHTYNMTVFETTFQNEMPDIMLVSRGSVFSAGIVQLFDKSEHIELEGDFNNYFTLRVPKGYETEAYQIFTPDIMADLIDKAKELCFEFNAHKLYIYSSGSITTREKFQAIFDLADWLDDLFSRKH